MHRTRLLKVLPVSYINVCSELFVLALVLWKLVVSLKDVAPSLVVALFVRLLILLCTAISFFFPQKVVWGLCVYLMRTKIPDCIKFSCLWNVASLSAFQFSSVSFLMAPSWRESTTELHHENSAALFFANSIQYIIYSI